MHVVSYGCYINVRVLFCKQLHHQSNTCTVMDLFHIVIFHFREKETGNSKTEGVHLVATLDCDDMSLVSYNSIRDCTPSATPKTASTSVQCNVGQLPQYAGNDLKVNMSKSLEFLVMHSWGWQNGFVWFMIAPKLAAWYVTVPKLIAWCMTS